jgi:hypothetical protein
MLESTDDYNIIGIFPQKILPTSSVLAGFNMPKPLVANRSIEAMIMISNDRAYIIDQAVEYPSLFHESGLIVDCNLCNIGLCAIPRNCF